jgi:hypothetical protein
MAAQDGKPEGSTGDDGLVPEDPSDVGLEPVEVDIVDVEPMHELANEAREELRKLGFDDNEIDDWAREYVAHEGPGDVDEFIAWVQQQERAGSRDRKGQ